MYVAKGGRGGYTARMTAMVKRGKAEEWWAGGRPMGQASPRRPSRGQELGQHALVLRFEDG